MAAPVVDAATLDVILAADDKRHSNPARWADISPFNISITGDGSPQFRVRDPGGTWTEWRDTTLSVDGSVLVVAFPDKTDAVAGEITSSASILLTVQEHRIQVRCTADADPGDFATVTATIGAVESVWRAQTGGSVARNDIVFTADFSSFASDVTNPTEADYPADAAATIDGLNVGNVVYDRTGGVDDTVARKAAVKAYGAHLEVKAGDHAVDGRAVLFTLYPPDTVIGADELRYDRHGTNAEARSRISMNTTASLGAIWKSERFAASRGYREDVWIGWSLYLPDRYVLDGNAAIAGTAGPFTQFAECFARITPAPVRTVFALTAQNGLQTTGNRRPRFTVDDSDGEVAGAIYWPWDDAHIGKKHYFVVHMRVDDRAVGAGGDPLFEVWHQREDAETGTYLGALTVPFGPTAAQIAASSDGDGDFGGGPKFSVRTYKPSWYSSWYAGTYFGQLRPTINTATYTQTGTTVTVTLNEPETTNTYRELENGNVVDVEFTSGTATEDGSYTVGSYAAGVFTFTVAGSRTTSGDCIVFGDKVITGIDSLRVGGPDSDYSSVHPTGAAQP